MPNPHKSKKYQYLKSKETIRVSICEYDEAQTMLQMRTAKFKLPYEDAMEYLSEYEKKKADLGKG